MGFIRSASAHLMCMGFPENVLIFSKFEEKTKVSGKPQLIYFLPYIFYRYPIRLMEAKTDFYIDNLYGVCYNGQFIALENYYKSYKRFLNNWKDGFHLSYLLSDFS